MRKLTTHWDKLRVFHQIAKIGSFKAAADVLNTSQPALSRLIILLESHFNTRLFERLSRGVTLTRQGEILFEGTSKINKILEETQLLLEEEENEPNGSLRLATTAGFAYIYLSPIVPEFLRKYPNIQLSINGSDTLPNLHSNQADALISPFIKEDDSLIQTYLRTYHLKLYASQAYLARFGTPRSVSDLESHRLLAFGDPQTTHPFAEANWHLALGAKKGSLHQPYIMINSAIGLFSLASAGMGIASISQEHPPLKDSALIQVLPDIKGPSIEAYFIYSSRLKKVKKIQVLREFLVESFKE